MENDTYLSLYYLLRLCALAYFTHHSRKNNFNQATPYYQVPPAQPNYYQMPPVQPAYQQTTVIPYQQPYQYQQPLGYRPALRAQNNYRQAPPPANYQNRAPKNQ